MKKVKKPPVSAKKSAVSKKPGGADLSGDFADLTLVTLSERLDVAEIISLDNNYDM